MRAKGKKSHKEPSNTLSKPHASFVLVAVD
jgi:hypothetical protein